MNGLQIGHHWDGSVARIWSVNLIKRIDALYAWFRKAASSLQSPFLLAIRLYWGWQFLASGIDHLRNMPGFVTFMSSHGVPAPSLNAHFVAALEAGGGGLVAFGLGLRVVALALTIYMIVAYVGGDLGKLTAIFTDHAADLSQ